MLGENKEEQAWVDLLLTKEAFSPFSISVDGMMGKDLLVVLATLIQIMATKIDEHIPHVTVWFNGWIVIEFARLYSRLLRGS